jgi:hypothetical protein
MCVAAAFFPTKNEYDSNLLNRIRRLHPDRLIEQEPKNQWLVKGLLADGEKQRRSIQL